jgi:hypothetical protein
MRLQHFNADLIRKKKKCKTNERAAFVAQSFSLCFEKGNQMEHATSLPAITSKLYFLSNFLFWLLFAITCLMLPDLMASGQFNFLSRIYKW